MLKLGRGVILFMYFNFTHITKLSERVFAVVIQLRIQICVVYTYSMSWQD